MDVSREMPGTHDSLSVKDPVTGVREHKTKRLVLGTLKEVYRAFKNENEDVAIGFSKFCELRPKECVLAGASGTHSVCVCAVHQNIKLMMEGSKMTKRTTDAERPINNYRDCLELIMCQAGA